MWRAANTKQTQPLKTLMKQLFKRASVAMAMMALMATGLMGQTSTKISDLPAASSLATTDLVLTVTDPSGTPVTKKATLATLFDLLDSATLTLTNKTISGSSNTITGVPWSAVVTTPTTLSGYGISDAVSASALASWTGSSNITTLGAISTGVWGGSVIDGTKIEVQHSIVQDASGIKLAGDSGSPGNNKVYGTNGSGVKGWQDAPSGGAAYQAPKVKLPSSTVAVADIGATLMLDNQGNAATIYLPADAAEAVPVGTRYIAVRVQDDGGSAPLQVEPGSGASLAAMINGGTGYATGLSQITLGAASGSIVYIEKVAADSWFVFGAVANGF